MSKAQIGMEYVVLAGILLVMLLSILVLSANEMAIGTIKASAENAVAKIANTADETYAIGHGTKRSLNIRFPKTANSLKFNNKYVILTLSSSTNTTIAKLAKSNMTGDINISSDLTKKLTFEMLESGVVNISG